MAKKVSISRSTDTGTSMVAPQKLRGSRVKFGHVTVSGAKPSAAAVKMNIEHSTQALERVARTLKNPGIALQEKTDVPQFSVAEGETGVFVRRLNGQTDRGRFVDGRFQVIE